MDRGAARKSGSAAAAPPAPKKKRRASAAPRPGAVADDSDDLLRRATFDVELALLTLPISFVAVPILIRNPLAAAFAALALATIPGAPVAAARLLNEVAVLLTPGGVRAAGGGGRGRRGDSSSAPVADPRLRRRE